MEGNAKSSFTGQRIITIGNFKIARINHLLTEAIAKVI
jgi:hypothetical protein